MIVWLASYPRSGNTLLRTILRQCMDYESYDDQVDESLRSANSTLEAEKISGHITLPDVWDKFYGPAVASESPVFVKTHLPPKDEQRAIYVVRDGRKALLSYLHFHRSFFPSSQVSLQELILGFDEYASWAEHIEAWSPFHRPNTMLLHYEELVNADMALLKRIANFIGYSGAIGKWQNPFNVLQQKIPKFYREGHVQWQGDPEWTEWIDDVFFYCHGQMMAKLDYTSSSKVSQATERLKPDVKELIDLARNSRKKSTMYEKECRSRLAVIKDLKSTCDNRLELINNLNDALKQAR